MFDCVVGDVDRVCWFEEVGGGGGLFVVLICMRGVV